MREVYNFSAGPSQMPMEVLLQAQNELINFNQSGTSVMEMSHRSGIFMDLLADTKATLKKIMEIDDRYEILFLPGGATTQFSMIPMNLLKRGETAAYSITGRFAANAQKEAARWGNAVIVVDGKDDGYTSIPIVKRSDLPDDAKYLHITGNNTVYGSMIHQLPDCGSVPLVADYSSSILGSWIDINRFGLVYAGAQKNMGAAGVAAVIIRKDLITEEVDPLVPTMYRYSQQAKNDSMVNTPPCWQIYMCNLMAKWVDQQGGIRAMEQINKEKSSLLYDFIDQSALYKNVIRKEDRSITNITFTLNKEELTDDFLACCQQQGLINLKGHKSVGGCRASLYNGMELDGVKKLIKIMKEFEQHV